MGAGLQPFTATLTETLVVSLAPPFILADRYTVTEEIGHGGHATVYRAHDPVLDREVAVKILREDALSEDTLARFRQEVQVTARLEHTNILHVYDTGVLDRRPYLVMELALGRTLAERLEREGQLAVADAVRITRDVGLALAHAHALNVVHRDVKPENILMGPGGALLADFGIARVTQEMMAQKITSTGTVVGTVLYMSPEQLCAEPTIDARSDQYSLACVLYEMLAGVRPHIAASFEGLRMLRMTGRHVPVSTHRPMVPAALDDALQVALSPMAADRFRTMDEFLSAIGATASGEYRTLDAPAATPRASGGYGIVGEPGGSRAGATPATVATPRWRNRRVIAPITVGALVIAGLLVAWWWNVSAAGSANGSASRGATGDVNAGVRANGVLTVRLVSLPSNDSLSAAALAGLRSELEDWNGVRVGDGSGDDGGRTAVALQPDARLVGDSIRVRLTIHPGGAVPHSVQRTVAARTAITPAMHALLVEALVPALDSTLTLRDTPGADGLPRSLPALREYVAGFAAMRSGEMNRAGAHFAEAARASNGAAHAHFWAAQSAAWAQHPVDSWRLHADAAARAGTLHGVDSMLVDALGAMSRKDFPAACASYRASVARDASSFVGWYGLGECQRADSVVVRGVDGYRFRSSHWSALSAYKEAVLRAPTPEWLAALFPAIMRTTYAESGRARHGRIGATTGQAFSAMPSLMGDTIAFLPLLRERFEVVPPPDQWVPAVRRGTVEARAITRTWVERWPHSAAAWQQRALALELSGIVADAGLESAPGALERAEVERASPTQRTEIAVAKARVLLRRGDVAGAVQIARAALDSTNATDAGVRALLLPLAALVGDSARAIRLALPSPDANPSVPPAVTDSLALFELRAALGLCTGLREHRASLENYFNEQFSGAELQQQRERLLMAAYRTAVPCLEPGVLTGFVPRVQLDRAYAALHAGDTTGARGILDSLRAGRIGATMAVITWDYIYAESWARLQAGDTTGARLGLLGALRNLASMSLFTLSQPAQAAGVRRGLLLLAEIGRTDGDANERKWIEIARKLTPVNAPANARERR